MQRFFLKLFVLLTGALGAALGFLLVIAFSGIYLLLFSGALAALNIEPGGLSDGQVGMLYLLCVMLGSLTAFALFYGLERFALSRYRRLKAEIEARRKDGGDNAD